MDAFKNWLSDPGDWRASLEGLCVSRIDEREAARLEVPFTEEEVRNALDDLNDEKAPGPNGYIAAFWHSNWEIVKGDILNIFTDFHSIGKFVKSLNSTFIVMVPKKVGAEDLQDLDPSAW